MSTQSESEKIFNDYVNEIYRFVYVRVNNREVAEDITSQTFTKLLEKENIDPTLVK